MENCKVLRNIFILLAVVVVISQIGLVIEGTRHYLTGVDILDGAVPASGGGVVKSGELTLSLDDGTTSDKISLLINGDEYTTFSQDKITIPITNQSVVEVVNNTKQKIKVSVADMSDNLTCTYMATDTTVDNISVICRVIFRQ